MEITTALQVQVTTHKAIDATAFAFAATGQQEHATKGILCCHSSKLHRDRASAKSAAFTIKYLHR